MSAAMMASIQITVDDCKNPNKPWFCMNESCENFLGLEKQNNVHCWHFCPSCLQKKDKIITDSKYRLSCITSCSYCSKMFCLNCTNFTLRKKNNSRCLSCQQYPEKPNDYDSPSVHEEDEYEEEEPVVDEEEFIPEMIFERLSSTASVYHNFAEEA